MEQGRGPDRDRYSVPPRKTVGSWSASLIPWNYWNYFASSWLLGFLFYFQADSARNLFRGMEDFENFAMKLCGDHHLRSLYQRKSERTEVSQKLTLCERMSLYMRESFNFSERKLHRI